jgi:hypothetical protein
LAGVQLLGPSTRDLNEYATRKARDCSEVQAETATGGICSYKDALAVMCRRRVFGRKELPGVFVNVNDCLGHSGDTVTCDRMTLD